MQGRRRSAWRRGVGPALALGPVLIAVALLSSACGSPETAESSHPPTMPPVNVNVGPLPGIVRAEYDVRNPYAGNQQALAEGRRYFTWYNCAGCHGDHGGGGMGPSLRDEQWLYGSSDPQIAKSIVDGRANGMPAWGVMLTEEQVWQITAYIKSMRTENEPSPPRVN